MYEAFTKKHVVCGIYSSSSFLGAEWWAQDFQKSMPLLGWVPFISGMYATILRFLFLYL